jgi:hypothetical protein
MSWWIIGLICWVSVGYIFGGHLTYLESKETGYLKIRDLVSYLIFAPIFGLLVFFVWLNELKFFNRVWDFINKIMEFSVWENKKTSKAPEKEDSQNTKTSYYYGSGNKWSDES